VDDVPCPGASDHTAMAEATAPPGRLILISACLRHLCSAKNCCALCHSTGRKIGQRSDVAPGGYLAYDAPYPRAAEPHQITGLAPRV